MPRRLGIIGTFVWDTVWTLEDQAAGRPLETWGGVSFSVASAAATRGEDWEIVPIAHVGADLFEQVHAYLDTVEGIGSRDGVVAVDHPNNRVELRYTDAANRGETMHGGVPGWTWPELAPHLERLDALYINFLSGWELDLATAQMLPRHFPGFVYADLHSLFLGPPLPDAPRKPRKLPRWDEWLRCFRAVQMNEDEYALLGEPGRFLDQELKHGGLGAVFITRAERGAQFIVAGREPGGPGTGHNVAFGEVAAHAAPPGGDPTGCGDVWGAANVCGLLGGLAAEASARRANAVAAAKLGHRGGSGLYQHLRDRRAEWDASG
ncbi:MAG TPA: PfkB family carbohydrate kinase [Longimicrobium sp.]|nr:PfkB family carbohydrate kinase [Longimicrobium sp.]